MVIFLVNIFYEKIQTHSATDVIMTSHTNTAADEIRDRIVDLCGDIPRIELFARQRTQGWDCWGNEV